MSKQSQCQKVLRFIREHGSITTWQAIHKVHCTRLSGRIYDLKDQGYRIKKRMVKGDGTRYARYSLA